MDKITGLNPVISIEQKSTSKNPRSTVGTITEIYDFLRLLFARIGQARSHVTGEPMVRYTEEQILDLLLKRFSGKKLLLLAPLIRRRKGHYRELFEQISKQGFLRARVDGEIREVTPGMKLDRYKVHDIETVIDRIRVEEKRRKHLADSLKTAMKYGKGMVMVVDEADDSVHHFSKNLMCPTTGIAYKDPEPNTFSFNSPYGACSQCNGLGSISEMDVEKIIPDPSKSIRKGGIAPMAKSKNAWITGQLESIGKKYGFNLDTPLAELSEEAMNTILYGSDEVFKVKHESLGITHTYSLNFEGIVHFIRNQHDESPSGALRRWAGSFMRQKTCPECQGQRLNKEALHLFVGDANIADYAEMDLLRLREQMDSLPDQLDARDLRIAAEILRELRIRLGFLLDVGLDYLSLNRPARSLSGGESQRIRLATQIGSQLTGVLYILDEPSIGLHQRDNHRLIQALKELRDIGNSVIVVEHDRDMILAADHLVDMGPGAGTAGGEVIASGTPCS